MKTYIAIVYAMLMMGVGMQRCIEAQAFKPNAFYFCLAVAVVAIVAGYCFRVSWHWLGGGLAVLASAAALAFYMYCLIVQPEKDATVRVGVAIVGSVGFLAFALLPSRK
ncbi:MAG: hypothetical protein AAFN77_16245 [Planctomycetota bacterium]